MEKSVIHFLYYSIYYTVTWRYPDGQPSSISILLQPDLLSIILYTVRCDDSIEPWTIPIDNFAPIDKGTSSHLSFCSSDDGEGLQSILSSSSGTILYKKSLAERISQKNKFFSNNMPKLFVFVDNPRLVFIKIVKLMKDYKDNRKGVSKHAIIAD